MAGSGLRSLVRTPLRRVLVGVGVLVPVLVIALGGFRTVELPPHPHLDPGESFELGPAAVRVDSYFVSDRVMTGMLPDGAQGWVGVLVDVTVHIEDEWNPPNEVFAVPALEAGEAVEYFVIAQDDSLLVHLEPDVPQRLALLYPVSDTSAVPEQLDLHLRTLYHQRSLFEGTMRWYPDEVAASVALPRTDEVPPALVEED